MHVSCFLFFFPLQINPITLEHSFYRPALFVSTGCDDRKWEHREGFLAVSKVCAILFPQEHSQRHTHTCIHTTHGHHHHYASGTTGWGRLAALRWGVATNQGRAPFQKLLIEMLLQILTMHIVLRFIYAFYSNIGQIKLKINWLELWIFLLCPDRLEKLHPCHPETRSRFHTLVGVCLKLCHRQSSRFQASLTSCKSSTEPPALLNAKASATSWAHPGGAGWRW